MGHRGICTGLLAAALNLAAISVATPALAQSGVSVSETDKAAARALVASGDKKFSTGDYEGALADYRGADTIMMVPTTGIEVARTLVVLHRLLEARSAFQRIVDYPATDDEPEAFTQARERAQVRLAELAERIPTLTVRVSGGDATEATTSIDGAPAVPNEPIELDPGAHTVTAAAPGYQTATQTVTLNERDRRDVVLTLTLIPPPPAPVAPPPPLPPPLPPPEPSPLPMLGAISLGIGGAGAIVGAITGAVSLTKASSFKDQQRPDGTYPASAAPMRDESVALAHVSTASFVIAGVLGLTGILLLTIPSDDGAEEVGIAAGPLGLELRGRF